MVCCYNVDIISLRAKYMKKYLLLTVTAGNGHNAVAKAIAENIQEKEPDAQVKIIDFFKYFKSNFKSFIINDMYMLVCRYFLKSYNIVYKNYQNLNPNKRYVTASSNMVDSESPKLLKEIYDFKPDTIVCTHFYPAIALSNIRLLYEIPSTIYSIVTDFTVHPFWESAIHIDYVFLPIESLVDKMIERGFKREQLLVTGIPVSKKFSETQSKLSARKELGLDIDKFTLLLFSGGFGVDDATKIFKQMKNIDRDFQLIIVNGKNKTSFDKIERYKKRHKPRQKIINIGFTDRVSTFMSAADLMIGKAGGITTNEALNKGLPLIIPCTLPLQELRNMEHLTMHNTAIYAPNAKLLVGEIKRCIDNPEVIKEMKKNASKISTPKAIDEVTEHIINTPKAKYGKEIKERNHKILNNIQRKKRQAQRKELLEIKRIKKETTK